jgi:hypothetical protein
MKTLNWLSCLFLLVGSITLTAQEPATGLIFDDEVYDTLSQLPAYDGSKDLDLPQQVDLSPYCPAVRNQGDIYSCVGWAVGYGAMTIRRAIRENWTDKNTITANAYSALFIYNQIREGHCRQGSSLSKAMELIRTKGDCPAQAFDFNVEDCEKQPTSSLLQLAQRDTISDYLTLFGRQDAAKAKIWKVKRALAQREPVIIGMAIRENFYQLNQAKFWWPNIGNTNPAGGHAMTVVGYDDQVGAFLIFNSWGPNWGDKGFIRIKYEDFAEHCKYAYLLVGELGTPAKSTAEPAVAVTESRQLVSLSGSSVLKYLDSFNGQEPIFKHAAVDGRQGVYRTRQQWSVGQLFQLTTATREANLYLYVFTVDAKGEVNIHWPRKGQLNKKFSGKNESALVAEAGSQITVPGPDKALRINQQGRDVLYMLFAKRQISSKGLKFISSKMQEAGPDPMQRLQQLMGKHFVPAADIEYSQDEAAFEASTRSEGYIVPLILITDSVSGDR